MLRACARTPFRDSSLNAPMSEIRAPIVRIVNFAGVCKGGNDRGQYSACLDEACMARHVEPDQYSTG